MSLREIPRLSRFIYMFHLWWAEVFSLGKCGWPQSHIMWQISTFKIRDYVLVILVNNSFQSILQFWSNVGPSVVLKDSRKCVYACKKTWSDCLGFNKMNILSWTLGGTRASQSVRATEQEHFHPPFRRRNIKAATLSFDCTNSELFVQNINTWTNTGESSILFRTSHRFVSVPWSQKFYTTTDSPEVWVSTEHYIPENNPEWWAVWNKSIALGILEHSAVVAFSSYETHAAGSAASVLESKNVFIWTQIQNVKKAELEHFCI